MTKAHPIPAPKREAPSGFQARFQGANLWDLVQIECLSKSRRVVRVTTLGKVGYLYFDGGNIVHANTLGLDGEAAAFEILRWDKGAFEPYETSWPTRVTIRISWQELMIRAAQAEDEQGRERAAHSPTAVAAVHELRTTESQLTMKAQSLAEGPRDQDFEVAVRLDENGDVIDSRGFAEDFAGVAAYSLRLVHILGDLLGMEEFQGIDCTFKKGRCIVVRDPDGSILAFKPKPEMDLRFVKDRI
ncbi:MAG TPA: DUF4388 domain-containing protein [Polyangiaceae bacterium]|nr:DUF4388 domain-containing protein [Polyangiaceae bacterium]